MGRSIFEEAKDSFNHVKEFHDNLSFKKRLSILSYEFKNRSLGTFFWYQDEKVGSTHTEQP